jgi:hypothetical protein
MSLLKESMENRLVDGILFATAIGAAGACDQWQRAVALLQEMQQWQLQMMLGHNKSPRKMGRWEKRWRYKQSESIRPCG